jgi:hypothetical protein
VKLIGDHKARLVFDRSCDDLFLEGKIICMSFIKHFLAGLLLTGMLALAPDTLFARGGGGGGGHFGGGGGGHFGGAGHFGGGGHFAGGGQFAGFHGGFAGRGFAAGGHGFHGSTANWGRAGGWHHDGGRPHYFYPWYNGYYGPFDYGLDGYDDYGYPYYDNDYSSDVQPVPSDLAPDESTSMILSVQNELARLGYYNGPIDGIAGSETEHAIRWFQSVDHLPVTGRIDAATLQALHIA